MNNYVQCQNCQYYLLGTCAYYEQPLDHYPDEDITCTDYAPKRDYCEQIKNITVPMSQDPEEIKQQWIQDDYEQGTQSTPINKFTEALLDWLDDPKSK